MDKRKEIDKAAKRLYVEERQMIQAADDLGENPLPKNKKLKKKVLKQRQLAWKVSETNDSAMSTAESSETGCNSSWEVSESDVENPNNNSERKKLNRRKLEEENVSFDSNCKPKKAKTTSFVVSDSKENSFSSPVASTPIKTGKQSVLGKQNLKSSGVSLPGNKNKLKSTSKKLKKKCDTSQLDSNGSEVNKSEHVPLATENGESSKLTDLQLNVSTGEKNNGWGGDWDESAEDVEYEIFIPNKKYVEKRKSLGVAYPKSSIVRKSAEKTPLQILKV